MKRPLSKISPREVSTYFGFTLRHLLAEPLHISEVLTMRQQFTLGIHPHGTLVGASLIGLEIETEGVQVALVLDKREWQYLVDGDVIGRIVVENHKLQANCVLQPRFSSMVQVMVFVSPVTPSCSVLMLLSATQMLSQRSATTSFQPAISLASLLSLACNSRERAANFS